MSKIDIQKWKIFTINDLFLCETSPSVDKRHLKFVENGEFEFIGRTNINNGIQGKINKLSFEPNSPNVFSVTQIGEKLCQFRNNYWYSSQNIFILKPKDKRLCDIALFINTVITKKLKLVYGSEYNSYPTIKTLPQIKILLPVNESGILDFEYINKFMNEIKNKAKISLDNILNTKDGQKMLDTESWREYKITDLFTVKNTHSILKSWVSEDSGNDPYVTASKENNGVSTFVDYDTSVIEDGNSILIGGKTLAITYQSRDFYSNDSHNLALYLKNYKYRTRYIQLFLVAALKRSLSNLYTWGDSISGKAIQKDYIKLPSKEDGTPDYEYMEKYMVDIEEKSKKRINDLLYIA